MKVYIVQHVHDLDDEEDVKLIGIYSSKQKADEAITRLQLQEGFRDVPKGFQVDEYELDEDHWTEGYITVQ